MAFERVRDERIRAANFEREMAKRKAKMTTKIRQGELAGKEQKRMRIVFEKLQEKREEAKGKGEVKQEARKESQRKEAETEEDISNSRTHQQTRSVQSSRTTTLRYNPR